jgi:hypothetical protein
MMSVPPAGRPLVIAWLPGRPATVRAPLIGKVPAGEDADRNAVERQDCPDIQMSLE